MQFFDDRLPMRFWDKVAPCPVTGCWLWMSTISTGGYGQIGMGSKRDGTRRPHSAHRVAYEALIGPIPEGLQLDHLCRNRSCCNVEHVEPVTSVENTRRGIAGDVNAAKTHCPQGHAYNAVNTIYIRNKTRSELSRVCRICQNAKNVAYRARLKAAP